MPKNRIKLATKLLRCLQPSTIAADDFSPDNDSAAWYSTQAAFLNVLGTAVQELQSQGFQTFKSGSCFADLSASRTGNRTHYDNEYFHPENSIVIPVLFDNDADGAAMESRANKLPTSDGKHPAERRRLPPAKSSLPPLRIPPLLPSSLTCCFSGTTSCVRHVDQGSSILYQRALRPSTDLGVQ